MNVIAGFARTSCSAIASVRSYVIFEYSSSLLPSDVTPKQNMHALIDGSSEAIDDRSVRFGCTTSRVFG